MAPESGRAYLVTVDDPTLSRPWEFTLKAGTDREAEFAGTRLAHEKDARGITPSAGWQALDPRSPLAEDLSMYAVALELESSGAVLVPAGWTRPERRP